MYKRLARSTVQASRTYSKVRSVRAKILFFVEGAKTERIYLSELKKNVSSKKLDIEIFDRWKNLSGESNQLKVVTKTKLYLEKCGDLTRKQRNKINATISLLEKNELTMDDIFEKITDLNDFLGDEILNPKEILLNQLQSIKTCYDFDESLDKICFVLDRDCGSFSKEQYDQVVELCNECNYELGMSTPNFEFYLLLHLTDAQYINEKIIYENSNDFILQELKKKLKSDYNLLYKKNKYDASLFMSKFEEYEKNILSYSRDNKDLKNQIGSSLGVIVNRILNE